MNPFQGVAELFLLVMLRVVAGVPGNQDEPGELRVDKLAMAAFATGDTDKARPLQAPTS